MVDRQKRVRGQGGFTLIEIIAVLVILGILAIVAIPKYFDMQDTARKRAAQSLVGSAMSQLSLSYSQSLLNTDYTFDPANECKNVVVSNGSEATTLTCTGKGTDATVSVEANVGGQTVSATWKNPSVTASESNAS